jgi:hypothetical protein
MTVIPNGYAQVNFKMGGTAYPSGAEVTFGVRLDTSDDPATVAATIRDITLTRLQDRLPTSVSINSILVKFGPNATGPFADLGVAEDGTGSSGDVNPNMAMLIKKVTNEGGRKGRGRMYWPVAEDQVGQAGVLKTSPDQVAAMNGALADWQDDLTTADLPPVLLHNDEDDPPTVITLFSTQAITATQRRRLRR